MARPRVLVTPWRRTVSTSYESDLDLLTIAPDYTDAIRRAGGLPLLAAHGEPAPDDVDDIEELLDLADALVVSGGQDMDPATYGHENTASVGIRRGSDDFDLEITRRALARGTPVLGICRGAQVVNVALGGDLRQEVQEAGSPFHPTHAELGAARRAHRHDVDVRAGTRLASIYAPGPISVNSLHHQAVGELAPGLVVSAIAPDGVVEAVEGADDAGIDVVAVQWHPEMLRNAEGDALFADLVARAHTRVGLARPAR